MTPPTLPSWATPKRSGPPEPGSALDQQFETFIGPRWGTYRRKFGPFFEELHEQIEEDRATLREVMRAVGAGEDPIKRLVALVAERAGLLKLNGSLFSYSPLSRLLEIEGLALGVTGKLALWRALDEVQSEELEEFDFVALAERAETQQESLEAQRLEAARLALAA